MAKLALTAIAAHILVIAGCVSLETQGRDARFAEILHIEDTNRTIVLSPTEMGAEIEIGTTFDLRLENTSSTAVVLPIDFAVRGYTYDDRTQQWIEVQNRLEYVGELGRLLGAKGGDFPNMAFVGFNPSLDRDDLPANLRVIVIGNIVNEQMIPGEQVAAYIDVTIVP